MTNLDSHKNENNSLKNVLENRFQQGKNEKCQNPFKNIFDMSVMEKKKNYV